MSDFSQYDGANAEWLAIEAGLPAPLRGQSLAALKKATNDGREAVSSEEMGAFSAILSIEDHSIEARDGHQLHARTYRPTSVPQDEKLPLVLHLHGGGHLFGTLSSEDAACARMVTSTGVAVLNLDYRHTPEATYPTPWNDVEDAIEWLHHKATIAFDPRRVILEGISAGAWMTASIVQAQSSGRRLPDCPPIAGQILMIPCLGYFGDCYAPQLARMSSPAVSSRETNKNAPILSSDRVALFLGLLQVPAPSKDDVYLNPGNATVEQATALPPTVIGVAGNDPLRDDGILYGQLLRDASVPAHLNVFKGVPHGFRRYGGSLSLSAHWDSVIVEGIKWILATPQKEYRVTVHE